MGWETDPSASRESHPPGKIVNIGHSIFTSEKIVLPKICLGLDGFVTENRRMQYSRDSILKFAQYQGFQGIEIHPDFEIYARGTEDLMKRHYSKFEQSIPGLQTVQITSTYSPISDDKDVRKQYVGAMCDAIEFASKLGAKHSTITPPSFIPGWSHTQYDQSVATFIETVSDVVSFAEKSGVIMAVEPEPDLVLNGGTYRDSIEDVKQLLDSISSKNLQVLYDVAHAHIISGGDPIGFAKQLKGRISWVHVADNDLTFTPQGTSKHLEFGQGNVPMKELIHTLKDECGSSLEWLQIDTWENPNPYHTAAKNKRGLENILKEIGWA